MNRGKNTILNSQTYQKSFFHKVLTFWFLIGISLHFQASWGQEKIIRPFFPQIDLKNALEVSAQTLRWDQTHTKLSLNNQVKISQGKWSLTCADLSASLTANQNLISLEAKGKVTLIIPYNQTYAILKTEQVQYYKKDHLVQLKSPFTLSWNSHLVKGTSGLIRLNTQFFEILNLKAKINLNTILKTHPHLKKREVVLKNE